MRFYLTIIEPNIDKIQEGHFNHTPLGAILDLEPHMGLQLEILLLQNKTLLFEKLGIYPTDVLRNGPYRQTKNKTQQGCQIDYLVHTKTESLYICEFKFKRREIGVEIIDEMREKISRLKTPKGVAKVPILFHLGGVASLVATNNYFYRIVNIVDFLELEDDSMHH